MTLFAQSNDKISYQAVVRNTSNQLVVEKTVDVTIEVKNSQNGPAVYKETHTVTTNANGLMALLIGDGTPVEGEWGDINWNSAYVTSTMTVDGETLTHTVPVNAVPYALYADNVNPSQLQNSINQMLPQLLEEYLDDLEITTEKINNYIEGANVEDDVKSIMNTLNENEEVRDFLLETLIHSGMNYAKEHLDSAIAIIEHYGPNITYAQALKIMYALESMPDDVKTGIKKWVVKVIKNNPSYVYEVANYYLSHVSAEEVNDAWDAFFVDNPTARDAFNQKVVDYAIAHREMAREIIVNYLQYGTADDVDALVTALLNNTAGGKQRFKTILDNYLCNFINNHGGNCNGTSGNWLTNPTLGSTTVSGPNVDNTIALSTEITSNPDNVTITNPIYTITYNNTSNNISATLNGNVMSATITDLTPYAGKTITITPQISVSGCSSSYVKGTPATVTVPGGSNTPYISGNSHTPENPMAKQKLFENSGVTLTANIQNYDANQVESYGFLISTNQNDIQSYNSSFAVPGGNVNNDKFSANNLGLSYCGKVWYYRAYLKLAGSNEYQYGDINNFQMWGPETATVESQAGPTVSATPSQVAAGQPVTLSATAYITVHQEWYNDICANVVGKHAIEWVTENCATVAAIFGLGQDNWTYRWEDENGQTIFTSHTTGTTTVNPTQTTTYTAIGEFNFNGETCRVSKPITVTVQ